MRKLWKLCLCSLVWVTSIVGVPHVRADVAPPGLQECEGKTPDEACSFGVCRAQTCSRLDYEDWDRDSGMGPPTVKYACVLCVGSAGSGGSAGRDTNAGAGAAGSGGSAGHAGTGAGGAPSSPDTDSGCGGCATGSGDLGLRSAALGFALVMGVLLGGRRRMSSR